MFGFFFSPENKVLELRRDFKQDAEIFSMVLLLCDHQLQLTDGKPRNDSDSAFRFFNILKDLPLELQMLICKRVYLSKENFYDSIEIQKKMESLMKKFKR